MVGEVDRLRAGIDPDDASAALQAGVVARAVPGTTLQPPVVPSPTTKLEAASTRITQLPEPSSQTSSFVRSKVPAAPKFPAPRSKSVKASPDGQRRGPSVSNVSTPVSRSMSIVMIADPLAAVPPVVRPSSSKSVPNAVATRLRDLRRRMALAPSPEGTVGAACPRCARPYTPGIVLQFRPAAIVASVPRWFRSSREDRRASGQRQCAGQNLFHDRSRRPGWAPAKNPATVRVNSVSSSQRGGESPLLGPSSCPAPSGSAPTRGPARA